MTLRECGTEHPRVARPDGNAAFSRRRAPMAGAAPKDLMELIRGHPTIRRFLRYLYPSHGFGVAVFKTARKRPFSILRHRMVPFQVETSVSMLVLSLSAIRNGRVRDEET